MVAQDDLEDLVRRLQERDPDWLRETLRARLASLEHGISQEVGHGHPGNSSGQDPDSSATSPGTPGAVWAFDRTTPILEIPPQFVSDYLRFIHEYDWASTELGPMASWDASLRRKVNMCLSDRQAAALWIGPKHLSFYNEAYAAVAGPRHPHGLGRSFRAMWGDVNIMGDFEVMLRKAHDTGAATAEENLLWIGSVNGVKEERWCNLTVNPIPDAAGTDFVCYNTVVDITERIRSSRRHALLLSVIQAASAADSPTALWQAVLHALDKDVAEVPFAAFYVADSPPDKAACWRLQGMVGLPAGLLPTVLDAQAAATHISSAFPAAMTQIRPYVVSSQAGTFPPALQHTAKSRVHGDFCHSAVLFPIAPSDTANVSAFALIGINPLTPYDDEYEQLLCAIMHECKTSLAALNLKQDQLNFADRLAGELGIKQRENILMESRFRKMADMSPVAMFHLDSAGRVLYANTAWRDLTGVPPDKAEDEDKSWLAYVYPEDQRLTDQEFIKLTQGISVSFEMRWKRSHVMKAKTYGTASTAADVDLWTIASAYPELDSEGNVAAIHGCLTDITPQKFMQDSKERELADARELKRQQENFMDMISHEMRNPMSAIVLTVESIAHELSSLSAQPAQSTVAMAANRMQESTEIIMTCVQHQKRIVDDVLTLSKFDSGLLDICPMPTQLKDLLSTTIKLFDAEVKKLDISLRLILDPSCSELDWLRLDPSRLQQIVINLLTNAIKFTSSQGERAVSIVLSLSQRRPATSRSGCVYVEEGEATDEPQTGRVFLEVEVIDTGRGMTAEESAKLFHKFTQASAKTYAEYGGSGLGLFICKQLCKLQGGAIGVSSVPAKGTTFAFYIEASRCAAPHAGHRPSLPAIDTIPLDLPRVESDVALATKSQIHILLVEDNLINQRVLRHTLERAKYHVEVANHGLEALDYIARSQFRSNDGVPLDVVLLDIEMPVCDGLECARRVREQQRLRHLHGHLPIIGVTANARAEQQQLAIEAGMDAVVTKPFKLAQLVAKLTELGIK